MILKMGEGEAVCGRMQIRMQNAEMLTQEQIQEFLKGSQSIVSVRAIPVDGAKESC